MLANSEINHKLVAKVIGRLLTVESAILLFVVLLSLIYGEGDSLYFLETSVLSLFLGGILILAGRKAPSGVGKREGAIIATFTWLLFSFIGAFPFWLSGSVPSFTDAFFESISGFTTTGATIINNIEGLTHGMLFWRSLTQWIGGLGIIVMLLALLPIFGASGIQLLASENAGAPKNKIHPKINDTAKRIFGIYIALTLAEIIALLFGGMSFFDAVCYSFSTISTGGFSTKQAGIGYYNSPYIEYVITIFMILSGVSFANYYMIYKRKFEKIKQNEELKYYFIFILSFTVFLLFIQLDYANITSSNIENIFRKSLFTVSSLITTTGMISSSYVFWKPAAIAIFIVLMMIGASAGSTGGGMKTIRIVISAKACYYELKRMVHPSAIIPVRYNKHIIREDALTRIIAFSFFYLFIVGIGIIILATSGMSFDQSIGSMISCLGGVGSGVSLVAPMTNFSQIPEFSKWFLSIVMITGRLELFTVLMIFTPAFWKK